jgi:hypothetical protein
MYACILPTILWLISGLINLVRTLPEII